MSLGQLRLLKQILAAGNGSASLPLPALRDNLERLIVRFPGVPDLEVRPVNANGCACEWLDAGLDERRAAPPTVLYLHGGGFVAGSARSHRHLAARLARAAGARGLVVDYRLAPEHPYPAALEDTLTAYRWLLDQGIPAAQVAIAGDSAGGGLAVLAACRLRDQGLPLPAALVAFSPWTDYAGTAPSIDKHASLDPVVQREGLVKMAELYLDGADPWDPRVSPLAADLAGLPPLLIHAGGAESLLDDALRLADRASKVGVPVEIEVWPDMFHVWHLFAGRLEEGRQAIESAGRYLSARLNADD